MRLVVIVGGALAAWVILIAFAWWGLDNVRTALEVIGAGIFLMIGLFWRDRRSKIVKVVDDWITEDLDAAKLAEIKRDKNYVKVQKGTAG